ncbi:MAG: hypothetical protein QM737_12510 [Ferruginibacter sp.]
MRWLFLAILTLSFTFLNAQNKKFSFKLGSEYELPRRTEDLSFFGNSKDGIVNLSLKKEALTIMRFNPKTLAQTSDMVIELPEATRYFNSEEVIDFGNNCYWMHSDYNKSEGKEYLYYDKINIAAGKIDESNKKLFETTKISEYGSATGFYESVRMKKYTFNFNADRNKVLISYRLVPEFKSDKKNYDKIGLCVYDEKMNQLWANEFVMPYTEAIMDNSDFSLDAQGNAYLLAKVYDSEKRNEKNKETGTPAYHFEIMKFMNGNKSIVSATISLDNYFINESSLIESALHEMVIACTYSKKSKGTGTDGIFLATIDETGKVIKYKNGYYEFPIEELKKFESARSIRKIEKKNDYEAPNINVRNVEILSDGSVFMACEENFIETTYSTDSRGFTTRTTIYYYEDILAVKINAGGEFEWLRKIPKKQKGLRGRGTMGFKLISDSSGYYFLYLDNKKNMELETDEVPKYHMDGYGGQVVVSKLDNKGVLTKSLLFDTRDEEVKVFPALFHKINNNQFIGRAQHKKNVFSPLLITVN